MQQTSMLQKNESLSIESQAMSASETLPYVHSLREETVTTVTLTPGSKTTVHETIHKEKEDYLEMEDHHQHHDHHYCQQQQHEQIQKEKKAMLNAINSSASTFASTLLSKEISSEGNSIVNKSNSQNNNIENSICSDTSNKQEGITSTTMQRDNNSKANTNAIKSKQSTNVEKVEKEHCKVHCTPLNNLLDHNVYTEEEVLLELEALRKRALLTSTPFNKHILPILTWYVLRDKFGDDAALKYVPHMNVNPLKTGSEALPSSFLPQINEIRRSKRASHDAFNANPHHYYNITPPRSSLLTQQFTEDNAIDSKDTNNNKKKTDITTNNKRGESENTNEIAQTENIFDNTNRMVIHNTRNDLHSIVNATGSANTITSTTTINSNNNNTNSGDMTKNNKNRDISNSSTNNSDVSKQTKESSLPSSKSSNARRICSFDVLASQSEMPIEPSSTAEVMTRVLMAETPNLHNNNNTTHHHNNNNIVAGHTGNSNHNSSHTSSNSTFSSLLTSASMPKFALPETVRREYDKLSRYTAFRKSMDAAEEKMEMESVVDVKLVAEPILQTQNTFRIIPRSQIWTPSTPTNSVESNNTFIINNNTNSSYDSANSKMSNYSSHNSSKTSSNNFVVNDDNNSNAKSNDESEKHVGSIITNDVQISKDAKSKFKNNLEKANAEVDNSGGGDRNESVNDNTENSKLYNSFLFLHNSSNLSMNGVEKEQQVQQHPLWQHKENIDNNNILVDKASSTPSRLTSCTPDMENYLSKVCNLLEHNNTDSFQLNAKLIPEVTSKEIVTTTTKQNGKSDKSNIINTFRTSNEPPLQGLTETETSSTLSSFLTSAHTHESAKAPSIVQENNNNNIINTLQHYNGSTNTAHNDINTVCHNHYKYTDTPLHCNSDTNIRDEDNIKALSSIDHVEHTNESLVSSEEECKEKLKQVWRVESDKSMEISPNVSNLPSIEQITNVISATVITDNGGNEKNNTIPKCNNNEVSKIENGRCSCNDKEGKINAINGKNGVQTARMWEMPEYASVPELLSYDLALLPHEHESNHANGHTLRCASPSLRSTSSRSTSSSLESVIMPDMISVAAIIAAASEKTTTTTTNGSESINSSVVSSSLEPSCNYQTQSDKSELSVHSTLSLSTANMNSSLLFNHSGSTRAPHVDMESDSNENSRSSATTMMMQEQIIEMINSSIKTMHLTHNTDKTISNNINSDKEYKNKEECQNNGEIYTNNNSDTRNNLLMTTLMEKVKTDDNTIIAKVAHDLKGDKDNYNTHNTITESISDYSKEQKNTEDNENRISSDENTMQNKPISDNTYKTHSIMMRSNNESNDNRKSDNAKRPLYNQCEKEYSQCRVTFNSQLQLIPSPELSSNIGESLLLRQQVEPVVNVPNTQTKSIISSKSNNSETSVNSSVFDINRFETALQRLLTEEQEHIINTDEELTSEECIQVHVDKGNGNINVVNSNIKRANENNVESKNNITEKLMTSSSTSPPVSLTHDVSSAELSHKGVAVNNNNYHTINESSNNYNKQVDQKTNYNATSAVKQNDISDIHSVNNDDHKEEQEQKEQINEVPDDKRMVHSMSNVNHAVLSTHTESRISNSNTVAKAEDKSQEEHRNKNDHEVKNKIYASPRPARRFHALGANKSRKIKSKATNRKSTPTKANKKDNSDCNNEDLTSQSSCSSLLSSLTNSPFPPPTFTTTSSSSSSSSSAIEKYLLNTNTNTITKATTTSPTSRPPLHPYSNPRPPSSGASTGRFARSHIAETSRPATAFANTSSHEFIAHHSIPVVDISSVPYVPSPNDSTDVDREMAQHTINERVSLAKLWAERGRAWRLHEEITQVNEE